MNLQKKKSIVLVNQIILFFSLTNTLKQDIIKEE